LAFR
jgi:hypothetical protein